MGSLGSSTTTSTIKVTTLVVDSVDAEAACTLLSTGQYGYIDVRMWEDFDHGHVAGGRNVPYYLSVAPRGRPERNPSFVEQVAALHSKEDHILVGCRQGVRSRLAAADLIDAGFTNVKNLEGGYLSLLKCVNPQPAGYHPEPATRQRLINC
ncbi:unnamed protein product [Alopecurus aequalis]